MRMVLTVVAVAAVAGVLAPRPSIAQSSPATSLKGEVRKDWLDMKKTIIQLADAMPADKFSYKPTPAQGSFGERLLHVAQSNVEYLAFAGKARPPVVNMKALKIYEVSKYASLTYHNYGPTNAVMNLDIWNGLTRDQQKLVLDLSRAAQEKIRQQTEPVDNFAEAKALLEPLGMTVVEAKVDEFRKVAQQKIWPAYKSQYGALWDEIEGFKA